MYIYIYINNYNNNNMYIHIYICIHIFKRSVHCLVTDWQATEAIMTIFTSMDSVTCRSRWNALANRHRLSGLAVTSRDWPSIFDPSWSLCFELCMGIDSARTEVVWLRKMSSRTCEAGALRFTVVSVSLVVSSASKRRRSHCHGRPGGGTFTFGLGTTKA